MCKIAPYGRTAIVHNFKLKLADKIILNFIKNKKIIIIFFCCERSNISPTDN